MNERTLAFHFRSLETGKAEKCSCTFLEEEYVCPTLVTKYISHLRKKIVKEQYD